jgi:cytochrome c-type biogenesis protein CcmF
VSFGLALALWVVTSTAVNLRTRLASLTGTLRARLASQPRGYYGMLLAHCGVAVFIAGVTLVKGYESERDVRMAVGDSVTVGAYAFRFDGVQKRTRPQLSRRARQRRGEPRRQRADGAPSGETHL